MKIVLPAIFVVMGILFLLISTIFFSPVVQFLYELQGETIENVPAFWDLSLVLKFVKIIFMIVGAFLFLFGVGAFWLKRRQV